MTAGSSWVLAGPGAALDALGPLAQTHRRRRPVRLVASLAEALPLLPEAAGVLLVGGGETPRRALPGPFLASPCGGRIPVGWLPDRGAALGAFAAAAAAVQARTADAAGPYLLLGEHDARAIAAVARAAERMPPEAAVLRWTADRLPSATALVRALGGGAAAALYFGHGLAGGWVGYGGFGRARVAEIVGPPLGAVLSLSCSAASRPRHGPSFCETLVLAGRCAAALGACARTLHRGNVALGAALADALAAHPGASLGALLLACRAPAAALARYRIVGDPLAPLAAAPGAVGAARAVFAPAPDATLPVVSLADWAPA